MIPAGILECAIVDLSLNEICFISDTEDIKYVSWDTTETFMYLWNILQSISHCTDVSYVYTTKYGVRR